MYASKRVLCNAEIGTKISIGGLRGIGAALRCLSFVYLVNQAIKQ